MDLAAYNAEKAGIYYNGGSNWTASSVSSQMDTFGWTDGWRIADSADMDIYWGGDPDYLWMVTPNVFILNTTTMTIDYAEKGDSPSQVDVISAVQQIDDYY